MLLSQCSSVLCAAAMAQAKLHHLFVGNLQMPASIHSLEFDDEALTFVKTATMDADSSHAWISFDVRSPPPFPPKTDEAILERQEKHLWGLLGGEADRELLHPRQLCDFAIRLDTTVDAKDSCAKKTSAFVMGSQHPRYTVYTGSWPGPGGCGIGISVHGNGTLKNLTQSWTHANKSAIHGLAFGRRDSLIYAADLSDDAIWTHRIDGDGVVEMVSRFPMPESLMHPRHVSAHSRGEKLYAVLERANLLVEYALDGETGAVVGNRSVYSLIPDTELVKNYWSAEVKLSATEKYLWATARANSGTDLYGYISCFELDASGTIMKRLFMVPTTTTGGIANAVSPSPFSDEMGCLD